MPLVYLTDSTSGCESREISVRSFTKFSALEYGECEAPTTSQASEPNKVLFQRWRPTLQLADVWIFDFGSHVDHFHRYHL